MTRVGYLKDFQAPGIFSYSITTISVRGVFVPRSSKLSHPSLITVMSWKTATHSGRMGRFGLTPRRILFEPPSFPAHTACKTATPSSPLVHAGAFWKLPPQGKSFGTTGVRTRPILPCRMIPQHQVLDQIFIPYSGPRKFHRTTPGWPVESCAHWSSHQKWSLPESRLGSCLQVYTG